MLHADAVRDSRIAAKPKLAAARLRCAGREVLQLLERVSSLCT